MKTYAIKQNDYVGATYTVGYAIANTPAEAAEKAKAIHPNAWADEIKTQDDMARAIEDLLDDANRETHHRMRGEARS